MDSCRREKTPSTTNTTPIAKCRRAISIGSYPRKCGERDIHSPMAIWQRSVQGARFSTSKTASPSNSNAAAAALRAPISQASLLVLNDEPTESKNTHDKRPQNCHLFRETGGVIVGSTGLGLCRRGDYLPGARKPACFISSWCCLSALATQVLNSSPVMKVWLKAPCSMNCFQSSVAITRLNRST
jgi:hypothetical protein